MWKLQFNDTPQNDYADFYLASFLLQIFLNILNALKNAPGLWKTDIVARKYVNCLQYNYVRKPVILKFARMSD